MVAILLAAPYGADIHFSPDAFSRLSAWLSLENHSWACFLFGFGAIFIITQMHGMGWSAKARWLAFGVFLASMGLYYGAQIGQALSDMSRIPIIYPLGITLLAGLLRLGLLFRPGRQRG